MPPQVLLLYINIPVHKTILMPHSLVCLRGYPRLVRLPPRPNTERYDADAVPKGSHTTGGKRGRPELNERQPQFAVGAELERKGQTAGDLRLYH